MGVKDMTTPDELTTVLHSTHGDPRAAVETFVTVHLAAAAAINAYTAVQQEAKKLIAEVMGGQRVSPRNLAVEGYRYSTAMSGNSSRFSGMILASP
jgi:hypothetical protein